MTGFIRGKIVIFGSKYPKAIFRGIFTVFLVDNYTVILLRIYTDINEYIIDINIKARTSR